MPEIHSWQSSPRAEAMPIRRAGEAVDAIRDIGAYLDQTISGQQSRLGLTQIAALATALEEITTNLADLAPRLAASTNPEAPRVIPSPGQLLDVVAAFRIAANDTSLAFRYLARHLSATSPVQNPIPNGPSADGHDTAKGCAG